MLLAMAVRYGLLAVGATEARIPLEVDAAYEPDSADVCSDWGPFDPVPLAPPHEEL